MLESKGQTTLAFAGINQQDFKQLQLVSGGYPALIGLHQRFPGKTLQEVENGPVSAIYVFYNTYGRNYMLTDFGGTIQITPVTPPTITIPALPPNNAIWFDDFSGYSPDGLISNLWGAGIWPNSVGICETIIQGIIDPFKIFASVPVGGISNTPSLQPVPVSTPTTPETPVDPTSPGYLYPPNHYAPSILLQHQEGQANNACQGQGTPTVTFDDIIRYRLNPSSPVLDTVSVLAILVGQKGFFHGVSYGRMSNKQLGLLVGDCPGPPWPTPAIWDVYADASYNKVQ
jgi:hypothetical protein